MDFDQALASDSIKTHSLAALFLRGEGARGRRHLPQLLRRCQAVDLAQPMLTDLEERLVGWGALSLGSIVNAVGYDESSRFHADIVDWLLALTSCRHVEAVRHGIYGMGDLGVPPNRIRHRLEELICAGRRDDDHEFLTCRAIAFRCLAAIDRELARPFVGSPACTEFLTTVNHWRNQASYALETRNELLREVRWLRRR